MYKRIGNYIQLVDNRNENMEVGQDRLLGINIDKEFMPSVANVTKSNLPKYKIIQKGQFAYSAMQVGRDETIRVVLFTDEDPAIISPAYQVFEVINQNEVYPEFLMMWFQRPESDRFGWFISDSSVRASLEWERFCDIEIPIPHIEQQKKYVDIYQGLLNNQKTYEASLDDLQLVCTSFMDTLKNHDNQIRIGDLVALIDRRNKDTGIQNLLGMNVEKEFMPSKANVSKNNLSKYKVIQKGQFAYSAMQVGRDETVRVALYNKNEPAIISPAYSVFEVKNENIILAEFLVLWFYRPEFNRYGWFLSDSSVRSSLEWERFTEIKVPVPKIETQKAIVTIYRTLKIRKRINNQLKQKMKPLCPVLMKGVIEELSESNLKGVAI